jgi:hypothetical protein
MRAVAASAAGPYKSAMFPLLRHARIGRSPGQS